MKKQSIALSIRLDLPGETRFGPGKLDLLANIESEGSISAAARKMKMSYPRALRLVDEMNTQFKRPLVAKFQGGVQRGGAILTETGLEVMTLYLSVTCSARKSAIADLEALETLCGR